MQRHELIEAMQALGLKGMAGAFDEIFSLAVKRQRAPEAIMGELLKAEQTEPQMRSIRYRISAVKLPETKDLIGFEFEETPINAPLVRSLHEGDFLAGKRNIVLVGEAGTGKTHLAIAIAANVVRNSARGRFRQSAGIGSAQWPRRAHRTAIGAAGPHRARRAWLSALRQIVRAVAVSSDLEALREDIDHRDH
jgi:DNA replication protein DnaC